MRYFLYTIVLATILTSCLPYIFTEKMDYGDVQSEAFFTQVAYDSPLGLVIIPVNIRGKMYRFLFDTGAPNAISEELQDELGFKVIKRKNIVDSQNTKHKVEWVKVDTITIGGAEFIGTTAFVSDLDLNPIIHCMDIDGIIGSNLMRFCYWQIDPEQKIVKLTNMDLDTLIDKDFIPVNFSTNFQHTPKIDLETVKGEIENLTLDYGFSGALALPGQSFEKLRQAGEFDQLLTKVGEKQSGLFGNITNDTIIIGLIENAKMDELVIEKVETDNGSKGLLGMEIFNRYIATFDWSSKQVWFKNLGKDPRRDLFSFGINFGLRDDESVYAQAVIVNSPAYQAGIRQGMKVVKYNEIFFGGSDEFCNFIHLNRIDQDSAVIGFQDFSDREEIVTLYKEKLFKNQ